MDTEVHIDYDNPINVYNDGDWIGSAFCARGINQLACRLLIRI